MARILFGIPLFSPDERFTESLPSFLNEVSKKHEICCLSIYKQPLVDAQNMIADFFLKSRFNYLCLLEDDHWRHLPEMVDALLELDAKVSAMNYHSRWFPYYTCLMREVHPDKPLERFAGYSDNSGSHECDMAGMAMMLIKREVFSMLDKPYFRVNKDGGPGTYATDIDFSERLAKLNIKPMGCFDYCLAHRDITHENFFEKRSKELLEHNRNKRKKVGLI